ncbi:hypothetical protein H8744_11610 [Oscillospiraceae bacterium N12]|uniref:Uncharacterized protein n=1 Tax=Jilunia laotingensis TaxID=2763675 RepID=A0A926IQ21_9BACT|nr:DUF6371 domain-containing protein [Jilunia laotingensis]MBC8593879.1 hypothetical protein [Jilunia laotingensis]
MDNFRYILQPYRRSSDRHICPSCGHKGEFSFYIDRETGQPLHPSVGKCNREQKCGYHYRPSEFFKDNPDARPKDDWKPDYVMPMPQQEAKITYLPSSFLIVDNQRSRNNLFRFIAGKFGIDRATSVFDAYNVGTSKHWRNNDGVATSFPQIDHKGRLCQIKVMAYNPTTGKRLKKQDYAEYWNFARKEYVGDNRPQDKIWFAGKTLLNNYDAHLRQTFFGCHLIPNASRIGVVESEKTSLICSILMPEITWIATGGCQGCKWTEPAVFQPLIGKRVVLYPDSGMLAKWEDKASILRNGGVNVSVSRICEGLADNTDVADVLLEKKMPVEKPPTIGDICQWMSELNIPRGRITFNI